MTGFCENAIVQSFVKEYPGEKFDQAALCRKVRLMLWAMPFTCAAKTIAGPWRLMACWNWLAVPLFHLAPLTFWQAMAVLLLANLRCGFPKVAGKASLPREDRLKIIREEWTTTFARELREWSYFLLPIAVAYWLRGMIG